MFSLFLLNINCNMLNLIRGVFMEIVFAVESDARALSYLKKRVWETTYRGIYSDSHIDNYDYKAREEKFRKLILSNDQEVYVCKVNGEIIGYMVLGLPMHESLDGYDLAINDLGIEAKYRGQGIGKKFLEIAKSKQKKLFNCCNYYNIKAQGFYERMGAIKVKTVINENDKSLCQIYYVY